MNSYLLIPLASCALSAILLGLILGRGPGHRATQLAATVLAGAMVWACCEVLWTTAPEPEVALRLVRLAAIGWVLIGPVGLHLFLEISAAPAPRIRRVLPLLYAISAVCLVVTWTTPWVHPGVVRTQWGWTYEVGPVFRAYVVYQITMAAVGSAIGVRAYRRSGARAELRQMSRLLSGIAVCVLVASLSHAILFVPGFEIPRIGSLSFMLFSLVVALGLLRYGYPIFAPGAFAKETLEILPNGVALLNPDGRVRVANDALARLVGKASGRLAGVSLLERLTCLLPEDSEVRDVECDLLPFEGSPIRVSISASQLRDKQGLSIGRVLVVSDLREVTALRNRVITAGRLASVGQLAAGVAHQINNPLSYVRANLSHLRGQWDSIRACAEKGAVAAEEPVREAIAEGEDLIDESIEGVDRAASIVRDIRGLSHAGTPARELVDLNALLDTVLRLASPQLRERVSVEKCYQEIPRVSCAPQELKQVFLNLILNASQAIGDEGMIRIATREENGAVTVCVEDDGSGIPAALLERVFDPFFTTKPAGGTGLGLAISYELVRRNRGEITAESESGRGTSFRVCLPVSDPPGTDTC